MNFRFKSISIPIALLITSFISYGLLIPWLGFYWDDWPYTWYAHLLGPAGFTQVFAGDRPFLSIIYALTSQIVGEDPVHWQIFGILCRWMAALAFWYSLQIIWPKYKRQITWVSFIFVVFPGFGQQWISVIYSRAFLLMAFFFLSFGLMAKALRSPKKRILFTTLALLCSSFALFSSEYFFGLELIRPFFIWFIACERLNLLKEKVAYTIKKWLPYFLLWSVFAIWRIFFFSSENYDIQATEGVFNNPIDALIQLVQVINETIFDSSISIWTQTLKVFTLPVNSLSTWLTITVVFISFSITLFYLWNIQYQADENDKSDDQWGIQASITGLAGIILSIIPFWAAGLPIKLIFPWDRFMLVIMVGASLLLVGIIEFFIKTEKRKTILLAIAIALSIGKHFETSNTFRRDWNNQKEFFWQLSWRAPEIEPDTMLLTHELPFQYYSDNSLTAPLNWIYAPDLDADEMPYMMVYSKARLGNSLPDLSPQQIIKFDYRALEFEGSTSDSIVFFYSTDTCLRILDQNYSPESTFQELPYQLTDAIPLSNLERIQSDSAQTVQLPAKFFGSEPAHGWCYYFEKADLARQNKDWNTIVLIASEVEEQGLKPKHPTEILPFIEGFANAGKFEKAEEYTQTMLTESGTTFLPVLCQTWERIIENNLEQDDLQERLPELLSLLNCPDLNQDGE